MPQHLRRCAASESYSARTSKVAGFHGKRTRKSQGFLKKKFSSFIGEPGGDSGLPRMLKQSSNATALETVRGKRVVLGTHFQSCQISRETHAQESRKSPKIFSFIVAPCGESGFPRILREISNDINLVLYLLLLQAVHQERNL